MWLKDYVGTGEKGRLSLSFAKFRKVERSHQGQENSWSESTAMSRGEPGETCFVEVSYRKVFNQHRQVIPDRLGDWDRLTNRCHPTVKCALLASVC